MNIGEIYFDVVEIYERINQATGVSLTRNKRNEKLAMPV